MTIEAALSLIVIGLYLGLFFGLGFFLALWPLRTFKVILIATVAILLAAFSGYTSLKLGIAGGLGLFFIALAVTTLTALWAGWVKP